jgi:hypothetical protein
MEAKRRSKADNSVRHTTTCEDDTMFQIEKEFRCYV